MLGGFGRRPQPERRRAELAFEIVAYGRLKATGRGGVLIEVPEVANRLRESPRHVRQSLRLLEMTGVAKKTHSKNLWKLAA